MDTPFISQNKYKISRKKLAFYAIFPIILSTVNTLPLSPKNFHSTEHQAVAEGSHVFDNL